MRIKHQDTFFNIYYKYRIDIVKNVYYYIETVAI